jgi:uncharacterized protein YegJ (DUF2314 family)
MARPIPVFAFAIAAYAATSGRRPAARRPQAGPGEIFLLMWRGLARDMDALKVKVGVFVAGRGEVRLSEGASADEIEEIWLDEISETATGFRGVVKDRPQRLAQVAEGGTIRFEARHVLGCTLRIEKPARAAKAGRFGDSDVS